MDTIASAPRLYILKSDVKIAHQAGYALYNGRWHKVHQDKPAPKGAPLSAHPHAAGQHAPAKHFSDEQWEQLKLPESNVNAPSYNKKLAQLKEWSDAGDVTAIVGSGYGTNTYGKKLATIANSLLGLHGSPHKVAAGQQPGWHAAVEHAPAEADAAATAAPAAAPATPDSDVPDPPEFDPKFKATPFYEKVAIHLTDLAAAGDIAALQAANDGSSAWQGKSENSNKLIAYHAALVGKLQESAPGAPEAAPAPAPAAPKPKKITPSVKAAVDGLAAQGKWGDLKILAPEADPEIAEYINEVLAKKPARAAPAPAPAPAAPAGNALLAQIPWDAQLLPDTNSNAATHNKAVLKIKAMAEAGDVKGLELVVSNKSGAKQTYAKKQGLLAQAALVALKEGGPAAPEPAASIAGKPAYDHIAQELKAGGFADKAAASWLAANPGGANELNEALAAHGFEHLADHGKPAEDGPKDGDTKPGAGGGTLVFKDGHWHLQGVATSAPAATVKEVAAAKSTLFNTTAGHNKQWSYYIAPNAAGGWDFVTEYGKIGGTQQKTVKPFSSQAAAESAAASVKKSKIKSGYAGEKVDWLHKVTVPAAGAAQAAPAAAPAAPAPAPKPAKPAAPGAIPSMDDWIQTGPQGGSNPGGKFKAPDGTEYYCKFPESEDVAKSEVLAAKLYAAAGLAGQDAHLVTKDGKVGIASRWVDVKKGKTTAALAKAPDACGGFAVDAWLANWDVVGLGYDNLQIGADGKAVRVDAGGSLEYRAQGSKKPFGHQVDEIDTLRDASKNPQAAAVFGKMTQADITASVAKVAAVTDADIWNLVQQFGPGDYNSKKALAATLIARKSDLLAKYPKAALAVAKGASWVRLKPGETIVETGEKFGVQWAKIRVPAKGFQAAAIPTPPNFFMNGSQGPTNTWKSSIKHVNDANNEAGQAIYDAVLEHKAPGPVESLTFDQIDKSTGQKTGVKIHFSQHPAGEIKEYFKQVTAELEAQTKATYKTVQNGSFTQSYSAAAASMAAEFAPVDYAGFKAHTAKAADYLVLSKSAAAGLPVPEDGAFEEQWENVSPKLIAFKNECAEKFKTLSSSEQAACKAYTGSSYANWNQALRSGDTTSNTYQSAQAMVKGMKKAAIDIPEGTILWRGIGVGEDTYKSVTGAVIQDGSFQSSSFGSAPAFSGYKTWLKIHVGKGVKGIHATIFSHFGSGEREIIIKNNVRYAVLNVAHHKNFVDSKGKSHGPKTIVDLIALPHED